MNKVNVTEAQTVNGGARWYCPECDYLSYKHTFLTTASNTALAHRNKYKGHHAYAFS